jgi:hypothetical protein
MCPGGSTTPEKISAKSTWFATRPSNSDLACSTAATALEVAIDDRRHDGEQHEWNVEVRKLERIYRKLAVHSKTEAVFEANRLGLIR